MATGTHSSVFFHPKKKVEVMMIDIWISIFRWVLESFGGPERGGNSSVISPLLTPAHITNLMYDILCSWYYMIF